MALDAGAGVQHYWGLDGDADDAIGAINGTIVGATTVAGSVGNALSFDEVDDHVVIPDVTYAAEFTVSFEFKVDDTTGSLFQYMYSHGDINSTNSINIFLNEASHGTDPNVLRTVIRDGNDTLDNTALQVDISGLVGDGQFHTYTATVSAAGIEIFIDGVSVASDATRGTAGVDPTGTMYLGARQDLDAGRRFGGVLDSVQIYDNALSTTQISDLSDGSNQSVVKVSVDQTLMGHWTFDADATDSSGNNFDGTLTNGATIDTADGTDKIGEGKLSVDGVNDYVDLSSHVSSFQNLTEGTISAWVYPEGSSTGGIFSVADSGDGNSRLTMGRSPTGKLQLWMSEGGSNLLFAESAQVVMPLNTWTHVAFTADSSGNKLYVNGVQITGGDLVYYTGSAGTTSFFDDITQMDFMAWGLDNLSSSYEFEGLIDDGRVYDKALTPDQLAALINESEAPTDMVVISSQTTPVSIVNAGFESQILVNDGDSTATITGWSNTGDSGVWNPTLVGYPDDAPEGENVAYIDTAGEISQVLTENFVAGRDYVLSAMIGDETYAADSTGWELRLYAGTQLLGSVSNDDFDPADGEFVKATLYLDAATLAAYSSEYGQALKIEIYDDGGVANFQFDDVALEYISAGATINVDEDAASNTGVAKVVSVTDSDAGDTRTYSLSDDAGGRFAIDAEGLISVANAALIDYETNTSHNVTVRVTDADSLTYDEVVTINVNDVNDAPTLDLDANDSAAAGIDFANTWTQGGGAVAVTDVDAVLSDVDSANLDSFSVTITNHWDGADEVLSADTTGTSIIANYDSATGVLTLSGSDTVANYQQVLRTIAYDNSHWAPFSEARIIEFVASDGVNDSSTATTRLTMATDFGVLVVTNTSDTIGGDTSSIDALIADDGGDGISLREAITASNNTANGTGPDVIRFDVVGSGPHTIALTSALPDITDDIFIDGTSEPDFGGTPMVVLDGSGAGAASGLKLIAGSDGSTIQGLVINQFTQAGIELDNSDNNNVFGNYIGTDATGTVGLGNVLNGVFITNGSSGNTIGGSTTAQRNVISGNGQSGVSIRDSGSDSNIVVGNYIGTDVNGTGDLGNGKKGVQIQLSASNNRIGGTVLGEGNIIAFNVQDGIRLLSSAVGNSILGNSIHSNTELGIDLYDGATGVTANDVGDADAGVNNLQNFPVLFSANAIAGNTAIAGQINTTANTSYRIEFFGSPAGTEDATGYGEAKVYLGYVNITTDGSGDADINALLLGVSVTAGDRVTATATVDLGGGSFGDTSEFAMNVVATANTPPVLTNGGTGGNANEGSGHAPYNSATLTDVDATDFDGGMMTFSIASGGDSSETLYLAGVGGVSTSGSDVYVSGVLVGSFAGGTSGSPLSITFNSDATVARVQNVYQALAFGSFTDNPTTGLRNFEVVVTDGDGGTSNTATASATITAVNDDPSNAGSLPSDVVVVEDVMTAVDLSSVVLADPDANTELLTVTLTTSTGGNVWASSDFDVTVFGSGTSTLTLVGGLSDLNNFFSTTTRFQYQHGTTHTSGDNADTIQLAVNDQGNTGIGGGTTIVLGSVNVDITAVNDAPVRLTGTVSDLTVAEDSGFTSLGLSSVTYGTGGGSDESSQTLTYEVTVIPDPNFFGKIYLADGTTQVSTGFYSLADIQGMQFSTIPDEDSGPSFFIYRVQDSGGTADGGNDILTETIQLDLTPQNDAPVADLNGSNDAGVDHAVTFTEGDAAVGVTDTDATLSDVDDVDYLHFGINLGGFVDGDVEEITIAGNTFQYGTADVAVMVVGGTSFNIDFDGSGFAITNDAGGNMPEADVQLLMRGMTYQHVGDDPTDGGRFFYIVPQDANGLNGTAAISTITVGSVNTAPVLTNGTGGNANEGAGLAPYFGATLADADSADFDGGVMTFSIASGGDATDTLYIAPFSGISTSGGNVYISGLLVGSFTGGTGGTPLSITFNADATAARVETIYKALAIGNFTQDPTTGLRNLEVVVTDGDGGTSNVGTATTNITAVNDAPTGADKTVATTEDTDYVFTAADFGFSDVETDNLLNVVIAGAPVNGTLYLDANADGIVDGGETLIATDVVTVADIDAGKLKFKPVADANGVGYDSFTFQVQDDGGTANSGVDIDQSPNTITIDVGATNDAPVGLPSVTGTVAEDQTLTADTSGISDADGLGAFSYQWLRDGVVVGGATASTYVLGDGDVGAQMSVQVSYTDGKGTAEGPLTSSQTVVVTNVNDAPTGSVVIDNMTPAQGDLLTASNTLADADGLSGPISYQWYRDGVAIGGATASTYTTTQSDVGAVMTTVASYTDDQGTPESVTSAGTAVVTNVNDAPTGSVTIDNMSPAQGDLLTASNTLADVDGLSGPISYQWYRDGVAIGGATASTYTTTQADVGTITSTVASYIDDQGTPESVTSAGTAIVTNVNDAPTGTVSIDNMTPAQGDLLTASNTLADADGLSGPISYQWYRDGLAIGGATASTYTTTQSDVGTAITTTASYTDDLGTAESVTSAGTAVVTNVNDAPTGSVTIDNMAPAQGDLLTASNTLADADGLSGPISYQWYRDGVAIGGATASAYTTTQADVGTVITTAASYTDDLGTAESVSSTGTAAVTNVNDAPTGMVSIDNMTPAQGDLLTASNTLADADGLSGPIGYQWYRDGIAIGGATASTYTATQSDVGAVITTTASYTDDLGTAESVSSAGTAVVTNVNDAPTGTVSIDNMTPAQGDLLTASNTLADADGLSGPISYQWYRDGVVIGGATASTYTTTQSDVGTVITTTASYTDDLGTAESATSAGTAVVTNINDAPTGSVTIDNMTPSQGDLLTASNTLADADGLSGPISYQWYRDGVAIGGATASTYTTTQTDVGAVITTTASYTDDLGTAESVTSAGTAVVANVNDAPTGTVSIDNMTPAQGSLLTASNTLADADGLSGPIGYQWYRDGVAIGGAIASSYTTTQSDVGTVITTTASYTDDLGTAESVTSAGTAVVTNVNDAPTGSVIIDNMTPAQGDLLTASNTLADADGLSGPISYQWYRDGVAIGGATASTYTTTQTDVGAVITTTASYTDDLGTAESVTSAGTAVVANVNDAPTGTVSIDNMTPAQGDLLTASNTLTDADGLSGPISYQWYRDGVAIGGATAPTYTTTQSDVGTVITTTASYTDDLGTAESVTSAGTAVVTNINDAPTGSVTIDNMTPAQGDLLTASNTLADADGLSGPISYQWYRDGVAIGGATASTYTTTQSDVGTVITTTASYTDDLGTAESVTSAGTAVVTNVNDAPTGLVTIDNMAPAQGDLLTASNTLADADGLSGPITYQWYRDGVTIGGATTSTYTTTQSDVGAIITTTASYTDDLGAAESVTSAGTAVVTNINDAPTGSVIIDNMTPTQGDLLTASNTLADADGLSGPIGYQWYRDGVAIGGASASTYTTTQSDVGTVITTTASYTDDLGTAESVTSAGTAVVTNVNDAPTGSVIIDNMTPAQGDLLIASNTLADADGLSGPISYQWYRDGVAIGGATASTYTTTQSDVGAVITTTASYTDDLGTAESVTSAGTAVVTNVNDAPTGGVLIDNMIPAQGDLLTASNTLADADGLSGPIGYQWYRDGVAIGGAIASSYTTTQSDVGSVITTTASYTDDLGTAESVTSVGTAVVTNVNDAPTGSVTIDNMTPAQGSLLTASNTLADADGLGGPIGYQWYRDGVAIGGAIASSYTTTQSDVGTVITTTASYTDDLGTAESVTSAGTAVVTNVNDAPTGSVLIDNMTPAQGDLLTASNTLADADGLSGPISYQWYRDGVAIGGATAFTYTTTQSDVGTVITTTASYTDDLGTAESVTSAGTAVVTNVNDAPTGTVSIDNMTPAQGDLLTASNTLADADGLSGPISYQWYRDGVAIGGATASTYTTTQTDVGAVITTTASYTDDLGTAESVTSAGTAVVANVNDAPTGTVSIDNMTPAQGDLLTASNTLADADGLSGPISYQWYRDGVVIGGATAATYTTTQSDVGTVITTTASYTDDLGTAESVTSVGTAVVTNVNDAPTGSVTIDNMTPAQGDLLTASNTLADADGLSGPISYQWYRDGVAIGGATNSTYTTTQSDVGTVITTTASYTDDLGTAESVTSADTAVVTNVNDAPTGMVSIDNMTPAQGDLLTASNTLADADGLSGPISYQWYRDGVAISGAIASTYTTTQSDVGTVITTTASYTDDLGTAESVTSAGTAVVTNVNDAPTGTVSIDNMTPAQGDLLTASNTLADADGLSGPISYQWYRDGVAIGGATASTYTTTQSDVGAVITTVASYTDDLGTAESVTSAGTTAVTNVNDAVTGQPVIVGTPTEDQTLLANTSAIADVDGLGPMSYQWYADGVAVAGETGITYVLGDTDVGAVIAVEVTFVDGFGTTEVTTSPSVGPIANVNDLPVVTPGLEFGVAENTAGGTAVGTVSATDVDTADVLGEWQITTGNEGGLFSIDPNTGEISVAGNLDYESRTSHILTVRVFDGAAWSAGEAVTINVTNVNEAPTVADSSLTTTEDQPLTINIDNDVLVNATDPEAGVMSVVGFTQPASGVLIDNLDGTWTYMPDANFNGADAFTYTVMDAGGLQVTATINLNVTAANDVPQVTTPTLLMIQEDYTSVTTIAVNDADGDVVQYAISGGADADKFQIDANGALSLTTAEDFESPSDANADNTHEVVVTVTDGNGGQTDHAMQISISDVNEAPVVADADFNLASAQDVMSIGQLSATDPDSGDVLTYQVVGGSGADYFEVADTGEIQGVNEIPANGMYELQVQVIDADGLSAEAVIRISVDQQQMTQEVAPVEETTPEEPETVLPEPEVTEAEPAVEEDTSEEETPEEAAAEVQAETDPGTAINEVFNTPEPTQAQVELRQLFDASQEGVGRDGVVRESSVLLELIFADMQDGVEFSFEMGEYTQSAHTMSISISTELNQALDQLIENDQGMGSVDFRVSGVMLGTMSLSAGFVAWMLRAGSLMASLLSTKPMWTELDPLPILGQGDPNREPDHKI